MEEQKKKVVKMQPATKDERPEKLSYEQLENVAHQLSEQTKQLYMKLQAANMSNMFKQDFLEKCIAEIEEIMTVPEETDKEEETPDIETED